MDKWGGEFYAHNALKDALITDRNRIPAETREQLGPLVAKYLSDE
jgi:hypothetical protein